MSKKAEGFLLWLCSSRYFEAKHTSYVGDMGSGGARDFRHYNYRRVPYFGGSDSYQWASVCLSCPVSRLFVDSKKNRQPKLIIQELFIAMYLDVKKTKKIFCGNEISFLVLSETSGPICPLVQFWNLEQWHLELSRLPKQKCKTIMCLISCLTRFMMHYKPNGTRRLWFQSREIACVWLPSCKQYCINIILVWTTTNFNHNAIV